MVTQDVPQPGGDAGGRDQWGAWLQALRPPKPGSVTVATLATWLEKVSRQLEVRTEGYRDAVSTLRAKWQAFLLNPNSELASAEPIVTGLVRSTEHLAAAEAMAALVHLMQGQVAGIEAESGADALVESDALLLFDSIARERNALSSIVLGDLLDALVKVTLALEVAEQHIEDDPESSGVVFAGLHEHVARAADRLRNYAPRADDDTGLPLADALERRVQGMRGIPIEYSLEGGGEANETVSSALLWATEELLNQLRLSGAERGSLSLVIDDYGVVTVLISSPSPRTYASDGGEPPWLLLTRMRMALIGGRVSVHRTPEGGSAVELRVGQSEA